MRHRQRATRMRSRRLCVCRSLSSSGSRAPVPRERAERHALTHAIKEISVKAAGNQMVQLQASMSDAASLLVRPAQQERHTLPSAALRPREDTVRSNTRMEEVWSHRKMQQLRKRQKRDAQHPRKQNGTSRLKAQMYQRDFLAQVPWRAEHRMPKAVLKSFSQKRLASGGERARPLTDTRPAALVESSGLCEGRK